MNTLEASFRVVTPMFLGGAAQRADTIRPASVKGALRFWWRALNWAGFLARSAQDEFAALRQLHAEEARLFGIAAGDEPTPGERNGGGQGVFMLQVLEEKMKLVAQPFSPMGIGQMYLLGMGLAKYKEGGKCLRNAIDVDSSFIVKLLFRPGSTSKSAADQNQIADALLLFGLVGALGSRARHGLGSITITAWTGVQAIPRTIGEYQSVLSNLLGRAQSERQMIGLPPFTAFSQLARIDISPAHHDPLALLEQIGQEQQLYRSFGQNGKVGGKPSERRFVGDHDLIYSAIQGRRIESAPKRAVFGLPHNYFLSSSKATCDVNYAVDGKDSRRASPLLLHMHALGSNYHAVYILLPAQFIPESARISVKSSTRSRTDVLFTPDWQVIHDYLNRFINWSVMYDGR